MAYAVKFDIPERALGRTDIEFRVWEDDSALGTLLISKGAVVWRPSNQRYGLKFVLGEVRCCHAGKGQAGNTGVNNQAHEQRASPCGASPA